MLIYDTHADIITIQATKLTPKAIHSKSNITLPLWAPTGCTRQGVSSSETTLHSLQQTYHSTINTQNTALYMVKVHINNTKHITIANTYMPPRDSTSTYYKTADMDCIQHIINMPHSVFIGDVNAPSTLWNSYTDDHRGILKRLSSSVSFFRLKVSST